ncbi:MAG: hypothetical protein JWN32_2365 [Solirubrobacterales bacterium]|nr:hypothetical protein [Solirubrobacterales bacterium]
MTRVRRSSRNSNRVWRGGVRPSGPFGLKVAQGMPSSTAHKMLQPKKQLSQETFTRLVTMLPLTPSWIEIAS